MERIRVNGRTLLRALAALFVLAVLALAGRADYNETVLTAMGRDYWDGLRQQ